MKIPHVNKVIVSYRKKGLEFNSFLVYICVVQVLEHMSGTILKSNEIGEELFRIGLTHLMSFKENR